MIRINNKNIQMPQPGGPIQDPNAGQIPTQDPSQMQEQAQPQMTTQEMAADLEQLMEKVNAKYQDFSTRNIMSQNDTQDFKEESLNKVFEILAKAGIDGNDPDQVNAFLQKLQAVSPEMYQYFVEAISSVMGEAMPQQTGQPEEDQGQEEDQLPQNNTMDNTSSIDPNMEMR